MHWTEALESQVVTILGYWDADEFEIVDLLAQFTKQSKKIQARL